MRLLAQASAHWQPKAVLLAADVFSLLVKEDHLYHLQLSRLEEPGQTEKHRNPALVDTW